jgi:hypothetical protein
MELPLCIGSMKANHDIDYTFSKNACIILSRAKRDTIWTIFQVKQESTQQCEATKGYPNYIKESNQHKIDSKVHQVNIAKSNEHKG